MNILLAKVHGCFEVRPDPEPPGMYKVGRGITMESALGDFLRNYQEELGVKILVDPTAQEAERLRRRVELSKR